MTFAHVIGKDYEYRLRNWFVDKGWKAERNPLSGASDQIEEQLGKHDVRAWREDLNIFLQIECKKTMKKKKTKDGQDDDTLVIQKEWLDKINFDNDEFLVFSYNRCQQHFAFMTKEASEKFLNSSKMRLTPAYEPRGDVGFGFKREWLEDKKDVIHVSNFDGKTWYAMDLEVFIDARAESKIPTKATSFDEQIKTINNINALTELFKAESANWKTRELRLYYSKLERLESGKDNMYNPTFIKDSQFWLDEKKKFDWDQNTIDQIVKKTQVWIDKNLEENDDGEMVWSNNEDITILTKQIKKILGLDNDTKNSK